MDLKEIEQYIIDEKIWVDAKGAAQILNKALGTIRNMTHMKNCPHFIKRQGKLYFEKESLEDFKKNKEVIKLV